MRHSAAPGKNRKGEFFIKEILEPRMELKHSLCAEDCRQIRALEALCAERDGLSLKLELDYKLGTGGEGGEAVSEFLYFDGPRLVGYAGICDFGGPTATLEISGMTHPDYRRLGVFSALHEQVMAQCARRKACRVLLLCDRKSLPGKLFFEKIGAAYQYSEYEMRLEQPQENPPEPPDGLALRKATNADALEVARQNEIYFADPSPRGGGDAPPERILWPEDEEKRGLTVYMAEMRGQIIGKVHLQLADKLAGIYGLGILPPWRGRGLGRALLLLAIEKLRAANATQILLQVEAENKAALRLYQTCGFRERSVMDYYTYSVGA